MARMSSSGIACGFAGWASAPGRTPLLGSRLAGTERTTRAPHFGNLGIIFRVRDQVDRLPGSEFRLQAVRLGQPQVERLHLERCAEFRKLWESVSEARTGVSGRIVVFSWACPHPRQRCISGIMGIGYRGMDGEFREGLSCFHRRARAPGGGAFRELWEWVTEARPGLSGRIVVFSPVRSVVRRWCISGITGIGYRGMDGSLGKDCRVSPARRLLGSFGTYETNLHVFGGTLAKFAQPRRDGSRLATPFS